MLAEGSDRLNELAGDINNETLAKNIGLDNVKAVMGGLGSFAKLSNPTEGSPPDASSFAYQLLMALIPSPELVGNALSSALLEDKKVDALTTATELERVTLGDRSTQAKASGRRASTTAKKCTHANCNKYHFFPSGLCGLHSGLTSKSSEKSVFKTAENTRLEDRRADLDVGDHYALISMLRSEMLDVAQTFDYSTKEFKQLQTEAGKLLKNIKLDDVEKAQLLHQFRLLDVNKNGFIDSDDLIHHINVIDPEQSKTLSAAKIASWLKEVNSGIETMTIDQYVSALLNYRKSSETTIAELNRYSFWDIRSAILSIPAIDSVKEGWLLKRGYYFSKENLNSWHSRFFRIEGTKLNYYTTIPGTTVDFEGKEVEHKLLKSVDLLDIAVVDFSPKTIAPAAQTESMTKPLTFKITTFAGKRLTLTTSHKDTVEWCALLSWFSYSSRQALGWRENFGSVRKCKITLRDYIMLGSIACKVGKRQEMISKDPKLEGTPKFEEEYGISKIDEYYLKLFGFTKENITENKGAILVTVKLWSSVKKTATNIDNYMSSGAIGKIIQGVSLAIDTYAYTAATKNAYNQSKYGVIWPSKSATPDCAICMLHFKSFSFRSSMSKHHCRCCGRVVCFNCAPEKVELARTGSFERICVECIRNGGIPPKHCIAQKKSDLKSFFAKSGSEVAGAVKNAPGDDEDDDGGEDLEESDDDDEK